MVAIVTMAGQDRSPMAAVVHEQILDERLATLEAARA